MREAVGFLGGFERKRKRGRIDTDDEEGGFERFLLMRKEEKRWWKLFCSFGN